MFAHGRETVSAQCLEPFVNAAETVKQQCVFVSRPCLASTAARGRDVLEQYVEKTEPQARPPYQASRDPPRSLTSRRRGL